MSWWDARPMLQLVLVVICLAFFFYVMWNRKR